MDATKTVDFSDFLWMAEEDLEQFEKEFEQQLAQEETMWDELEQMLVEEETCNTVYFSSDLPELATLHISDEEDYHGYEEECEAGDGFLQLNPEAQSFVPLTA